MNQGVMKENLILVYGDSLCLPRVIDDVALKNTFPELLADYFAERGFKPRIFCRGEGYRTVVDHWARFQTDAKYFIAPGPDDLLVIQAGMVDCAPRPMTEKWRLRLEKTRGFIRNPIIRFIRNNRPLLLKLGFEFYKADTAVFKKNIEEWLVQAAKVYSRIAVVAIPPIRQGAEDNSPGWQKSIERYNEILAAAAARHPGTVFFVPLHEVLSCNREKFDECLSARDGYHLAKKGHQLIRDLIVGFLEKPDQS